MGDKEKKLLQKIDKDIAQTDETIARFCHELGIVSRFE